VTLEINRFAWFTPRALHKHPPNYQNAYLEEHQGCGPLRASNYRSSTVSLEEGLDGLHSESFPFSYFPLKGNLVDPRLHASNEHILIVRVPRAGGRLGYPSLSIS